MDTIEVMIVINGKPFKTITHEGIDFAKDAAVTKTVMRGLLEDMLEQI